MSRWPGFPISLYLRDRTVLVIGEGAGADRRAAALSRAGATVERIRVDEVDEPTLRRAFAVVAQTDDKDANAAIATAARAAGTLAYAHDQPAISDFAMPAVAERSPLKIAISTDGVSPALAAHMRRQIDALLANAGSALDELFSELSAARRCGESASRLERIASRLRLVGRLDLDPPPDSSAD